LEFPILYAAGKDGYAKWEIDDENIDMKPLFEAIIEYVPSPSGSRDKPYPKLRVFQPFGIRLD